MVELLVTIALIGVMAAGVVTLIGQGPNRTARDGRRQADLSQIQSALELYRNSNGNYPQCPSGGTSCDITASVPSLATAYMQNVPDDPLNGTNGGSGIGFRQYTYAPLRSDGTSGCNNVGAPCMKFNLCASSEVGGTTVTCGSAGVTCANGSAPCVFKLTNP